MWWWLFFQRIRYLQYVLTFFKYNNKIQDTLDQRTLLTFWSQFSSTFMRSNTPRNRPGSPTTLSHRGEVPRNLLERLFRFDSNNLNNIVLSCGITVRIIIEFFSLNPVPRLPRFSDRLTKIPSYMDPNLYTLSIPNLLSPSSPSILFKTIRLTYNHIRTTHSTIGSIHLTKLIK